MPASTTPQLRLINAPSYCEDSTNVLYKEDLDDEDMEAIFKDLEMTSGRHQRAACAHNFMGNACDVGSALNLILRVRRTNFILCPMTMLNLS